MIKKCSKKTRPAQIYTGRLKTPHLNPKIIDIYQLQINGNLAFNFSYLENQSYDVEDVANVFLEELYSRKLGSKSFDVNEGRLVDLTSGATIEAEELDYWNKVNPLRVIITRGLLDIEVMGFGRFL